MQLEDVCRWIRMGSHRTVEIRCDVAKVTLLLKEKIDSTPLEGVRERRIAVSTTWHEMASANVDLFALEFQNAAAKLADHPSEQSHGQLP